MTAWCIYKGTPLEAWVHDSKESVSWDPTAVDKALRCKTHTSSSLNWKYTTETPVAWHSHTHTSLSHTAPQFRAGHTYAAWSWPQKGTCRTAPALLTRLSERWNMRQKHCSETHAESRLVPNYSNQVTLETWFLSDMQCSDNLQQGGGKGTFLILP